MSKNEQVVYSQTICIIPSALDFAQFLPRVCVAAETIHKDWQAVSLAYKPILWGHNTAELLD